MFPFDTYSLNLSKLRYRKVSFLVSLILAAYFWYSATVGSLPSMAEMEASSAEARNTLAPLPSLLGKLRVEVLTTVDLSATLAWLPEMQIGGDREGRGVRCVVTDMQLVFEVCIMRLIKANECSR